MYVSVDKNSTLFSQRKKQLSTQITAEPVIMIAAVTAAAIVLHH
jgi:hypothetical protein